MNAITAVIKKDLMISRKSNIIGITFYLLMVMLVFLFRFAYIYGNLASADMFDSEADRISSLAYMDMMMPLVISVGSLIVLSKYIISSSDSDFKCRWFSVLYSSGAFEKQAMAAKHIETILSMLCGAVLNLAVCGVYFGFFASEYSGMIILLGVVIFPLIAASAVFIMSMLMYVFKKSETVIGIVFFSINIFIGVKFFGKFISWLEEAAFDPINTVNSFAERLSANIPAVTAVCAAVFVIVGAVTYFIGTAFLKRREKLCGD